MDWKSLRLDVTGIFSQSFASRDGRKVPEASDVALKNDAVKLDAVVLYADIDGSTRMAATYKWSFAAKIYKAYLHSACRVIRDRGGTIVGFDGDRVMAVFIGNSKNSCAAKCGLGISYATKLINKRIKAKWPKTKFVLRQCVGVDASLVRAVRTGIRGSNDLVWVGTAPNYAAKMTELRDGTYSTYISSSVYGNLNAESKTSDGKNMWKQWLWTATGKTLYRSSYSWGF